MAEIWKPQSREVYKSWCDAIADEASDLLNNWETNFVSDIADRLRSQNLNENQANKLEQIYAKYTK